ncbi:MAG: tetratricopeptide repeat protein [Planctomycetota bacterium]
MARKRWMIAVAAIVLAVAAYFVFGFVRGISCYNRGTAHTAKGEYGQAIACFDKAIRIEPGFAQAYCNRGTAYYEKKQYDSAIRDFDKALEISPSFAEAYYNRAVSYYHKKEYDKARQDVQKAQSLGHQVNPEFLKALQKTSGRVK